MAASVKTFVNSEKLANIISEAKGYSFIKLTTTTKIRANKFSRSRNDEIKALKAANVKKADLPPKIAFTDVFKGDVYVTSNRKGYGMGEYEYQSMVNNKRAKEDKNTDFVSESPKGKTWVKGSEKVLLASISDENKKYVRTYKFNDSKDDRVLHYEDGTPLTDEEIEALKDFTTPSKPSKKQDVDNEIIVRDFGLDSIIAITINNQLYVRDGFQNNF